MCDEKFVADLIKKNKELALVRNLMSQEIALLRDQRESNFTLLKEEIFNLEFQLNQTRDHVDKCKHDIVSEREVSGKLMREKAICDRLLHDSTREKEQLSSSLQEKHSENGQLKANASILNAKIVELQTELRRANEDREFLREHFQVNITLLNEENSKLKSELIQSRIDAEMCIEAINADQERQLFEHQIEMLHLKSEHNTIVEQLERRVAELLEKQQNMAVKEWEDLLKSIENWRVNMNSMKTTWRGAYRLDDAQAGAPSVKLLSKDLLITSNADLSIDLRNAAGNETIRSLRGHTHFVISLALLSNTILASGSTDDEIRIWNIESGQCLRTLMHYPRYVSSVNALLRLANAKLASGLQSGLIAIWNLDNGELIRNLFQRDDRSESASSTNRVSYRYPPVLSLASLHRSRLASGRADSTIQIWDLVNYVCLKTLTGNSGAPYALQTLPGNVLVSASANKTLTKWTLNVETCEAKNIITLSEVCDQQFTLEFTSNNTKAVIVFNKKPSQT